MQKPGLGKIIYTQDQIQQRVTEIARQINDDYNGKDLVIICVLKGSLYFVADLTRQLTLPISIDFLALGLCPPETPDQPGVIRFTKGLDLNITGRHVLLVEDIIGTGLTLGFIRQHLESLKPDSLKICTLLDNPAERLLTLHIDYRCFVMPDTFVVGYGLDYNEHYRNLPYIAEYRQEK